MVRNLPVKPALAWFHIFIFNLKYYFTITAHETHSCIAVKLQITDYKCVFITLITHHSIENTACFNIITKSILLASQDLFLFFILPFTFVEFVCLMDYYLKEQTKNANNELHLPPV